MKNIFEYKSPFPDSSPMPMVTFDLSNALGKNTTRITAGLDTGFDGFLIIPSEVYNKLNLKVAKIPKTMSSYGMTISGERIEFNSSYGLITLTELFKEIEIEVDSTFNCLYPLVGRQLLSFFKTILNGPENSCEIEYTE